jgi:ABC-type nitrate/sulfonate/bicarbonate transport system substrate-binding protein
MMVNCKSIAAAVIGLGIAFSAAGALAQDAKLPTMTKMKALSVPYFALEFIAQDEGLFKKYNLDVEFVTQVAQGAAGIPAIISNQVQTGQGYGAGPIIQALAGGAKVTAVMAGITSTYGDFRLYAAAESGIKSAKDLVGKSFGISNIGSYADIALLSYLGNANVDVGQVRRITVPLSTMCQALLSKQVDAVAMYSLFYVPCEQDNPGKLTMLAKDSDAIPAAAKLYSAYVFADDFIKANPGTVRAYVAAMTDAIDFVEKNPAAAKKIIATRMKIDESKLLVPTFAKGGCIDTAAAADWVGVMEKYKAVEAGKVSKTSWVSNQYNARCR